MKKTLLFMAVSSLVLLGLVNMSNKKADKPAVGPLIMPEYKNETRGIIVVFDNGDIMLLNEENAIILGGDMNFTGLKNGDDLTIYYDDLEESFPSKTIVKEMIIHSSNNIDKLPKDTLNKLESLGWTILK